MKLSKDHILQIINDIAEDDCRATRQELIAVVNWQQDELIKEFGKRVKIRDHMLEFMLQQTKYLAEIRKE